MREENTMFNKILIAEFEGGENACVLLPLSVNFSVNVRGKHNV